MEPATQQPVNVFLDMVRDCHRIKGPVRILASANLHQWMLERLEHQNDFIHGPSESVQGDLYFRGVPIVECEQLQGLEYAFVNGSSYG